MKFNDDPARIGGSAPFAPPRPGLLTRLFGGLLTIAALLLALMFSAAIVLALVLFGLVAGSYLMWKMRGLRRRVAEEQQPSDDENWDTANSTQTRQPASGQVYEGEVVEITRVIARPSDARGNAAHPDSPGL